MPTWLIVILSAVPAYLAGMLTPLLWVRHDARRARCRRRNTLSFPTVARESDGGR